MSLAKRIKKEVLAASQRGMDRLFADPKRAEKIASALGTVQRGKQAMDRGQAEVLRALNFAPIEDYKAVGKQLSGLKRRLRELDGKLAKLAKAKTK